MLEPTAIYCAVKPMIRPNTLFRMILDYSQFRTDGSFHTMKAIENLNPIISPMGFNRLHDCFFCLLWNLRKQFISEETFFEKSLYLWFLDFVHPENVSKSWFPDIPNILQMFYEMVSIFHWNIAELMREPHFTKIISFTFYLAPSIIFCSIQSS